MTSNRVVTADAVRDAVRSIAGPDATLTIEEVLDGTTRLLALIGADPEVYAGVSVRTIRYYRQKGIVDAPEGRTVNACYGRRHVLQAAFARLAGHLHRITLEQAAARSGASDEDLLTEIAELASASEGASAASKATAARPLPGTVAYRRPVESAVVFDLGGGAFLTLPTRHPVLTGESAEAVRKRVLVALAPGSERGSHTD